MIWHVQKSFYIYFHMSGFSWGSFAWENILIKNIWNLSNYSHIYGSLLLFLIDNKHWYSWLLYILKWCVMLFWVYMWTLFWLPTLIYLLSMHLTDGTHQFWFLFYILIEIIELLFVSWIFQFENYRCYWLNEQLCSYCYYF